MSVETKLMLTCLTALAALLVYGVLRVITAWYEHNIAKHDLIVNSKQRRYDYLKAIADRDRELMELEEQAIAGSVIIEDDETELAQAA